MVWTKKHCQFVLRQNLRPSATNLLQWVLRRSKINQTSEIEIDLRQYNQWLARHRGRPYDRKTLRMAIAQLDNDTLGMVTIIKRYNPWDYKILVRPLSVALATKSQTEDLRPNQQTTKPFYSASHKQRVFKQQQQEISKIGSLLSKLGLRYTQDAIVKLWRLSGKSYLEVKSAVEMMLYQNSSQKEKIRNAHGWLYDCLRFNWHQHFDPYYQAILPEFSTATEAIGFVSRLADST